MLPYLLFACLIILVSLSLKLLLSNPHRKLNIYLCLIPGISSITCIIEIVLYYISDAQQAFYLFWVYQILGFAALAFLLLSILEYIKNYTKNYNHQLLSILRKGVIYSQIAWVVLLIFHGPIARIYLASPNKWDIDFTQSKVLFYCHNYFLIFCLILAISGFVYLAFKAESKKKAWSFRVLAFWELLLISGVVYIIIPHNKANSPQYYFISTLISTFIILINVWVLSNFSLFDITAQNIYADVLAATNNWIIVMDEDGKIKFVNNTVLLKANLSKSTLLKMNIDELFEVAIKNDVNVLPGKFIRDNLSINFSEITLKFKKSASWLNLQSSFKKIILPDKMEAYLWVLIDNTNIEALKINKAIIEADKEKLSKTHSDISFIMNMTSHDLKVPLKTIIELTELVKIENKLPGVNRTEEYLDYIISITNQSLLLTTQMIEYMRIGVIDKKMEWINMHALLDEIKERLFIQILKSNARIIYSGIVNIYCDQRQIKELFVNFIDNAIKYQTFNEPIITIDVKEEEFKYFFRIKDNGIGIDSKFLPKIFSTYTREEKKTIPGSGIGLYLCKTIIENNKGTINIHNNKAGNGITIDFDICKNLRSA